MKKIIAFASLVLLLGMTGCSEKYKIVMTGEAIATADRICGVYRLVEMDWTGGPMDLDGDGVALPTLWEECLSGPFMGVDFAKIAEAYGCRGYTIRTLDELRAAIAEAKTIEGVPVLFDIRVLPKSMTEGYGSWWRVGDTEVSENPRNLAAYEDTAAHVREAMKY